MKILLLNQIFNFHKEPAPEDNPAPNLFGIKSMDDLCQFLEDGGQFDIQARNRLKMTQAMIVTIFARTEGLKLFAEKDGLFNPKAKDARGRTEAMWIAGYAGLEGLRLYAEQGHKFNPAARDNHGRTEAMWVADHTGMEGLNLIAGNCGKVNLMNDRLLDQQFFKHVHYPKPLNNIPQEVLSPKATQPMSKSIWLPSLRNS